MEVSRTLILPDFGSPSGRMLATLALFWESIELPIYFGTNAPAEEDQELVAALIDEGVLRLRPVKAEPGVEHAERIEAIEVARAWARTPPGTTSKTLDMSIAEEIVVARAHRVARSLQDRAVNAMEMASELWAVCSAHAATVSSPSFSRPGRGITKVASSRVARRPSTSEICASAVPAVARVRSLCYGARRSE
jgi:hypothetical protein